MELKLEKLKYHEDAIQAVVKVFDGTEKDTFDNACSEGIRSNVSRLTAEQIQEIIWLTADDNGLEIETLKPSADSDLCIEMETGTGKTLVFSKGNYELYNNHGFTKFICLERALDTIKKYNLKNYIGGKFITF